VSTKTLRENIRQCKPEGKDFKRDYAKEKLRENMGQSGLRKETLKNRKEDFRSKVLKIEKGRVKRREAKKQ
jgi:hypothetical protein